VNDSARNDSARNDSARNDSARNDKVYIHEFIHITKQNRARYMHHMTANWSPIAQEQRHQLCYGVWGVVGSTGPWPQTVNLWEEDGFAGLADSFALEFGGASLQDPALAKWWATAADLRSGGFDRILVPHPSCPTIETLCAEGVSGTVYAHELCRVAPGSARDVLHEAVTEAETHRPDGWSLIGAFFTAMADDSEVLFLWAIDGWRSWGAAEALIAAGKDVLLPGTSALLKDRLRLLLVDSPLSPMKTGRQPQRSDRTGWED
jgi:hypothetical protein